jgi:hypothetical protein
MQRSINRHYFCGPRSGGMLIIHVCFFVNFGSKQRRSSAYARGIV